MHPKRDAATGSDDADTLADELEATRHERDAARVERDAAVRELTAMTRMSARQRVRFEANWKDVAQLTAERDRAVRDLERIRRQPAVRTGLALRGLVRSIRTAGRRSSRTAQPASTLQRETDWRSSASSFRIKFLAAVHDRGAADERSLHVAIVVSGDGPAVSAGDRVISQRLLDGFEGLGVRASILAVARGIERAWDPTIDVAVIVSAGIAVAHLAPGSVSIAMVHDRVDDWLADPRFDDHDIVVVGDDSIEAALGQRSARTVVRGPGSLDDRATVPFLLDVLEAWARAPKVAIHIGPLTWEAAAGWGDTPFARALQKEFGRRGWQASVHVFADRDCATAQRADVALHIFGARAPLVRDGQLSLLWVISHPDRVSSQLCDSYDVVFAASDLFARQLAERIRPPVVRLHQATDPDRFHPDPGGPPHEILFVGNSRKIRRRVLADLEHSAHEVAVYGGGWTPDLLSSHRLVSEWIPNWELRRYYSSAAIVLCDHYDDMRDEGFISNRAYDALACDGFVISDRVPGIEDEFDGGLVTYEEAEELVALVDWYLGHPDERKAKAARGRAAVLARHTFAHRVDSILAEVTRLRADLGELTR